MSDEATVADLEKAMKTLIDQGMGDHIVTCNNEYSLVKENSIVSLKVDIKKQTVDLSCWC